MAKCSNAGTDWRPIGGRSDGVTLYAIKGLDYLEAPAASRTHAHEMAYRRVDELKAAGAKGHFVVWGDLGNRFFRWPILAVIA